MPEQYFHGRPLQVHLFKPELHALLTRDPSSYGGTHASLNNIYYALRDHEDRQWLRLRDFRQIPLHRFRRIEIHLIPQLANINLPDDKLEVFCYDVPNVDDDESLAYEDIVAT